MGSPPVRAAFAALLLATLVAFFVAQQLKGEFPLVLRFAAEPNAFSPNHDGTYDYTIVGFDLSERAKVTFSILDQDGNEVTRLVDNRTLQGDRKYRFTWRGRDSSGRLVPDGAYRMRVIRRDQGRVINSLKHITVDTRRPRVRLVSARPGVISTGPGEHPRVRIRYRGPKNKHPEFRIFRTDGGPTRVVYRFRGDKTRSAVWKGNLRGRPAPDGHYAFTVKARDRAGNASVAPRDVPSAVSARAGTGVVVRHLALSGPLEVVKAGSLVRFRVDPPDHSFQFAVSRLDGRRAIRRGRRRGGRLRVRIPRDAKTGVYLVRVRVARWRAQWPVAVQGRTRSRRSRPLVVLPAATWQGRNAEDDDFDGFAETLAHGRSVGLDRPFARLPAGLRGEAAPLLRFLDSTHLPYDLTTDVSLARGKAPSPTRPPGIAFAGTEEWLPEPLAARLRAYVQSGGRLASFGAGSFRRAVQLTGDRLRDPTPARTPNYFGESTSLVRDPGAELLVDRDDVGLFEGVGPSLGSFSVFERSRSLDDGAKPVASAGQGDGKQDFLAYRLRRGLVIRTGTPEWTRGLSGDTAAPAVTRRIWQLLGRG
jgi:hypothetical protein